MVNDQRRLVLVVDTDPRFIDEARVALTEHRVLSVPSLDEATEVVLGGRVDLTLLGPAYGSDVAISQAAELHRADPGMALALVADVTTNRLLKSALRAGFADVIDGPLERQDVTDLMAQVPVRETIDVMVESAPPAEPAPSVFAPEPQVVPVAAPVQPVAPAVPDPAPLAESPTMATSPTEATFQVEPASVRSSDDGFIVPVAAATPITPAQPAATLEATPASPTPATVEPSPKPPPEPSPAPVAEAPKPAPPVPETHEAFAPPSPTVLDQVLPAPPATPPPTAPPAIPPVGDPEPVPSPTVPLRRAPGGGQVIAVMAGKGGSGKSIVATNLAIALGMRRDPERIAIVDADLQFGDVALLLQIDPIRTLDDLIGGLDGLSDERLDAALLRHESGLRVLPAPVLPGSENDVGPKQMVEVVERLRMMYDIVVVDTGPVFDEGLIALLDYADDVVSVVDMDLPSVKNAKVALDRLRQTGFDMEKVRLVVNRVNSKARLDLVELERSLGLRVGGSVPSDRLVPQSVNEGIPVIALSPRSKVARAFHALAEAFDANAGRDRLTRK